MSIAGVPGRKLVIDLQCALVRCLALRMLKPMLRFMRRHRRTSPSPSVSGRQTASRKSCHLASVCFFEQGMLPMEARIEMPKDCIIKIRFLNFTSMFHEHDSLARPPPASAESGRASASTLNEHGKRIEPGPRRGGVPLETQASIHSS